MSPVWRAWYILGVGGNPRDTGRPEAFPGPVSELAVRASQAERGPMDGNLARGSPRDCLDLKQI